MSPSPVRAEQPLTRGRTSLTTLLHLNQCGVGCPQVAPRPAAHLGTQTVPSGQRPRGAEKVVCGEQLGSPVCTSRLRMNHDEFGRDKDVEIWVGRRCG